MKIELLPRTKSNVIPLFLAFIQSGASVCKSNKTSGLFPPILILQFELKSVHVIQYFSFYNIISPVGFLCYRILRLVSASVIWSLFLKQFLILNVWSESFSFHVKPPTIKENKNPWEFELCNFKEFWLQIFSFSFLHILVLDFLRKYIWPISEPLWVRRLLDKPNVDSILEK